MNGVLEPVFQENPNISEIGENEFIKNVVENNKKAFEQNSSTS